MGTIEEPNTLNIERTAPSLAVGLVPDYHLETIALHAGTPPDPTTGAILTPIYQTTTFRQERVREDKGFTYSRAANPTVSALERRLAALEGAEFCTCYASGLAATAALCLALLRAGDRVVISQAVYGGTVRLFQRVLAQFNVRAEFHSAEQRICRLLLAISDRIESNTIPLTHERLSEMTGTKRPHVTTILDSLNAQKLVSLTRGKISILNREGIDTHACECYRSIKEAMTYYLAHL